jgi:hypothetical protein
MLVTKFGRKVFDADSSDVESFGLTCCEAKEGRPSQEIGGPCAKI